MKLKIRSLGPEDYGIYKCVSKNSLGDMEGSINVYRIPDPNKFLQSGKRQQGYEDNIVSGSSKKVQEVHPKRHSNDTSRRISLEHARQKWVPPLHVISRLHPEYIFCFK
ncbi:unnamed protein product [Acanthoscelides obtectus]|nr:unnamed protein product [Acanthoscelides obtectus]CAK1653374.1 hypothetical protein AOBTE_LOCUS18204 [Acanthoscelides obtectus]